jgi:hypothetical protein
LLQRAKHLLDSEPEAVLAVLVVLLVGQQPRPLASQPKWAPKLAPFLLFKLAAWEQLPDTDCTSVVTALVAYGPAPAAACVADESCTKAGTDPVVASTGADCPADCPANVTAPAS